MLATIPNKFVVEPNAGHLFDNPGAIGGLSPQGRQVAAQLERGVRGALGAAGLPLSQQSKLEGQDPAACEANTACFALIGRALGAWAVVRVDGAMVGTEVAVQVQALESRSG